MAQKITISILGLISTAIFIVLQLITPRPASPELLFLFNFLYLVILPGYLLADKLLSWTRGTLRILISLTLGTAAFFAVLFPLALFRLDILLVRFMIPPLILFLSLWKWPDRNRISEWGKVSRYEIPPDGKAARMILVVILVLISILIIKTGDPLLYTGDSPDHIAYIRAISRTHEAFPEQFYYRDGGILTKDIRKGMVHACWGTLNALAGNNDIHLTWPLISLIGSIFVIIALFCAGKVLFQSDAIGLLSAILFLLYFKGGLSGYRLATIAAGYPFGQIFYLTVLAFIPRYLETPKPSYLLLIAAAIAAACGTHIAHFVIAIFIILVFALIMLFRAESDSRGKLARRTIPSVLAVGILINMPYLVLRYMRDYSPSNPIHTVTQGILYLTKDLYVMNPVVFVPSLGSLGLLSIVALLLLWSRCRHEESLRMMFWGLITYYILILNPLWYPFLLRRMSYLLIRFEFAVPPMIVSAYLLRELWPRPRSAHWKLGLPRTIVGVISVAALLGPPLLGTFASFAYAEKAVARTRSAAFTSLEELYDSIRRHCPPGSVVISDPITSFGIPAFTDQYAVCPFDQHATPNDSTAVERIADCRMIYDPYAPITAIAGILRKYEAEYIMMNGRIPPSVKTMYWKPDREFNNRACENLNTYAGAFRALHQGEDFTLFRIDHDGLRACTDSATGLPLYVGGQISMSAAAALEESGLSGILIKSVEPDRERVSRGDTLRIRITWIATEEMPFDSYISHLRFDTDFEKNFLYNRNYGKIYRKILEAVKGRRFRFRHDFQPFSGIYSPDCWVPMHEIREDLLLRIPRDVCPGRYTVSVKMTLARQYPNYTLSEILTDEDLFSGAIMNRIDIE